MSDKKTAAMPAAGDPGRATLWRVTDGGRTPLGTLILARSLRERTRGLLGRDGLPPGEFMLLDPCGSIHTFGMRFAIDVLFLDRDNRVVRVAPDVAPGRMRFGGLRARRTIETASGWLDSKSLFGAFVEWQADQRQ